MFIYVRLRSQSALHTDAANRSKERCRVVREATRSFNRAPLSARVERTRRNSYSSQLRVYAQRGKVVISWGAPLLKRVGVGFFGHSPDHFETIRGAAHR